MNVTIEIRAAAGGADAKDLVVKFENVFRKVAAKEHL